MSVVAARGVGPVGVRALRVCGSSVAQLLRMFAGCVFSSSLLAGALVFSATALTPYACLLGLLAVLSALATAYALGLVSDDNVPTVYTYNALFIGIGASHTFADGSVALWFTVLGAAATSLLTAAIRGFTLRVGLPSLALPFVLVYLCAISGGQALGLAWAAPPPFSPGHFEWLPWYVRMFFDGLGAIVFNPRTEVGLLIFAALLVTRWHAALLAAIGFYVAVFCCWQLRDLGSALVLPAALNSMFTALGLGMGWYAPSWKSYARAVVGTVLCVLITKALWDPLARVQLAPLSLPFNLSIYVVLLIAHQQQAVTAPAVRNLQDHKRIPSEPHPDRRLLGG